MDKQDYWTLDDTPDVKESLTDFANILEQSYVTSDMLEANLNELLHIMSYLKSSSSLRLVNWLDEHFQDSFTEKMVREASHPNNIQLAHNKLFLNRLTVIKDVAVLGQVFSGDRLETVKRILTKLKDQGAI